MKLGMWLNKYKNMTKAEYKQLDEIERWEIFGEHQEFCRKENLKKQNHENNNWIKLDKNSEEYKRWNDWLDKVFEKERLRYETSKKIGGIDSRGNYTRLSSRF